MAILLSVNIGQPQPIPGKSAQTGIYKSATEGEVVLERLGLAGDAVMDRKHHGGVDQAVYCYFGDDYAFWAKELGRDLDPGTFGENLTIGGIEGRTVAIGDRFQIGDVLLEVTSHRTPCSTFSARMGDPGWVRRFHKAGRPGAYCRVIKAGTLHSGAPVLHRPYDGERVTMAEVMALDGVREIEPDVLRRILTTPCHHKMRTDFENRLARLF